MILVNNFFLLKQKKSLIFLFILADFTTISEKVEPEVLISQLSEYLEGKILFLVYRKFDC